jgi:xanthine dehydrogenase accessory factor
MRLEGPLVLIRGGGDLATGVAARLYRCGFQLIVTELEKPKAIRRLVALAEAVYAEEVKVEDLHGRRVTRMSDIDSVLQQGEIPVLVDPQAESRFHPGLVATVDARMLKQPPETVLGGGTFVVGLGPGFQAGVDCHAVVETKRGHHLGRVYWEGSVEPDTGVPGSIEGHTSDRILRAPAAGKLEDSMPLGSLVGEGETIARVRDLPIEAPFQGVLRGLVHASLEVMAGEKVGDLDPRLDPSHCYLISDKALAIGGGVVEALLSQPQIRRSLGG